MADLKQSFNADAHFSLITLPPDILLQVFQELSINDILALRQTCHSLNVFTRERSVWHDILEYQLRSRGLPVPGSRGRSLATMPARQLEHLTTQALRLHRNWTSARPRYTKRVEVFPPNLPEEARARNLAVYYLPGRGNRYLLTVTFYDQSGQQRKYAINCWDLAQASPKCVATLHCMSMTGVLVNSDPNALGIFALTHRHYSDLYRAITSIYSIDFSADDSDSAFEQIISMDSYPISLSFDGTTFVASDSDQIVRVLDTETGNLTFELRVPLEHNDPTLRNEEQRCMAVLLLDDYILSFCRQWIHLYSAVRAESEDAHPYIDSRDPIASHKWHWRIADLLALPQQSSSHHASAVSPSFPSIDILVRFDTWFPWPVNILHHYVLSPSTLADALGPSSLAEPSTQPVRLPYLFTSSDTPVLRNSMPSPIRLFTPSDMVLGRHGTAIWLDAQSYESGPAQVGDRGQRIAGKMLRPPARREDSPASAPKQTEDDQVSPGLVEYGGSSGDRDGDGDGEGSAEADREPAGIPHEPSPTMTFLLQEGDGWNRLAMDEEEGRLAVGTVSGRVWLYDYAPQDTMQEDD